jgi:hypothetical protein
MNAEEASALARQYADRVAALVPASERMDLSAYVHAAFMQGWSEERNARLRNARAFVRTYEEQSNVG